MTLFRAVIKSKQTHDTELILLESTDFGSCLKVARQAITDGIEPAQIDILVLNQIELWISIWAEREMCPKDE